MNTTVAVTELNLKKGHVDASQLTPLLAEKYTPVLAFVVPDRLGIMSSKKSGPPAHQNAVAWVPARMDKHNTLRKLVAALPNAGVCDKCHKQIEWKKQYGKYKPLKVPGKCTGCGERNVEHAYHALAGGEC